MLVQTNTYLKCGVLGISHFHTRNHHLCSNSTWRLSSSLASHSSDLVTLGSRYTAMSFQALGKTKADVVHNDELQEFLRKSSYEAAMEALSALISSKKRGEKLSVSGKYGKLERMEIYLKILGLEEKISGLRIIHVAGTKGKVKGEKSARYCSPVKLLGSTCAFCEAILRECGFRTGLFISPHLIDVRERFRIDGLDISEEKFLLYFWDCWSQLKENVSDDLPMPPLFQFLILLAFKMFTCEQVDVAIIEVGLGGKNDSTNVIKDPVVCGIASLGMDHMETLGNTIEQIAAHKAGIFKPQIPAFSVPQLPEAMNVLRETACGLRVPLEVAAPLDNQICEGLKLGLSGDHQFVNAGLAISLCKSWLERTGKFDILFRKKQDSEKVDKELPEAFLRGLSTAQLSGRAQIVEDIPFCCSTNTSRNASGELIFYLDGAHSPESMDACARWFSNSVRKKKSLLSLYAQQSPSKFLDMNFNYRTGFLCQDKENSGEDAKILEQILLFNCMDVRDPWTLLPHLVNTCASSGTHFSKALFVPSMSTYNKVTSAASVIPPDISTKDLSWQFNLQKIWEKIIYGKDVLPEKCLKAESTVPLPPYDFLYEDVSRRNPADRYYACSAVIPTLPMAINWLRDCVKENPSLRLQVLVTGSLHLVGDVLKLLRS